jgi:hypothetical protein
MARESLKERNRKQKIRQKELRDANRRARRPSRDDLARVALYALIRGVINTRSTDAIERLEIQLMPKLIDQGFDPRESELLFERLVKKYKKGPGFLKKRHLQTNTIDVDAQMS